MWIMIEVTDGRPIHTGKPTIGATGALLSAHGSVYRRPPAVVKRRTAGNGTLMLRVVAETVDRHRSARVTLASQRSTPITSWRRRRSCSMLRIRTEELALLAALVTASTFTPIGHTPV